jgi:hypothetical protein
MSNPVRPEERQKPACSGAGYCLLPLPLPLPLPLLAAADC